MDHFETLVLRAQSGILPLEQRQDAFAELVRRFQNLILTRAQEKLNDQHWAQDVAQETFLSAWLNLERLQHPRAFPSWLKRILNSQCHKALRGVHPEVTRFLPFSGSRYSCPMALSKGASDRAERCDVREVAAVFRPLGQRNG